MPSISLDDGRLVGYEEWGQPSGYPMFFLHGTPGCRLSRHPDPTLWRSLNLRVVTLDRPGYGESTPLPGRGVSHAAHDVAALADALGLERFIVLGISGGGPHALACAAVLGDRVTGCGAVASAAPRNRDEIDQLLAINRESYRVLSQEGRPGMVRWLGELREGILADPIAALRVHLADAPTADVAWNARPDVQAVHREAMLEALRPGVEGWVDDAVSVFGGEWDIDLGTGVCPVRFWHSDDDKNAPLSSIRRVVAQTPHASLSVWAGGGHSAPGRHMRDILVDLIQFGAPDGDSARR